MTPEELSKMSHDEYQQYWLGLIKKEAETSEYCREILDMTINMIDTKDYSHLYYMIQAYDKLTKDFQELELGIKWENKEEHLFWSYCSSLFTQD